MVGTENEPQDHWLDQFASSVYSLRIKKKMRIQDTLTMFCLMSKAKIGLIISVRNRAV